MIHMKCQDSLSLLKKTTNKLEMCQYNTDASAQDHPHPPAGILQKIKLKKGP